MSLYRLGNTTDMSNSNPGSWRERITDLDIYALDEVGTRTAILRAAGLIISGNTDQLQLRKHSTTIEAFVNKGGKLLINAQIVVPFMEGLALWQKIDFKNANDLKTSGLEPHPVFENIDYRDLHYRTGAPGKHSYEQLERIGVAGFYGRGFHLNLPNGATAITGIGALRLPIDYSYRIGEGEVLVHAGNDLESFADGQDSTANLGPNIVRWLESGSKKPSQATALQCTGAFA